jgi:glycosyltransferase involved in cell wall biosynthesis
MVAANKGFPARKSWPEALAAFAGFYSRHPDALLYLHTTRTPFGSNGAGIYFDDLIDAVGLPREAVTFVDEGELAVGIPDAQMADVYRASDVLLMPSMGEGFGLPLLEAQACGCPVIAQDCSAMSELVKNGVLVQPIQPFWLPQLRYWWQLASVDRVEMLRLAHHYGELLEAVSRKTRDRAVVTIGWLADHYTDVVGGAELSDDAFLAGTPEGVEVVCLPPNKRPPDTIDAFVLNNCIFYGDPWMEVFKQRPIVKHIHDLWPFGSPYVRRWVLDNAALVIFNSPKQREIFQFPVGAPYTYVPPPVDVARFRAAAEAHDGDRQGVIWLGRVEVGKGIQNVVDWALRNDTPVDQLVPPCRYCGPVDYGDLPELLACYEKFIHLPVKADVCGRVAVEAWAAGCELILGGDVDAFESWVKVADFQNAVGIFWDKILKALEYGRS